MWPLYHLVLFDTLLPCVACGTLSALLLRHFAQSAAWALLCIPLFSLFPLFGGWAQAEKNAGSVSRDEYEARKAIASTEAKKPGPLRMFKKTASNTFRPKQIDTRATTSAPRLDLSGFCHVIEVNEDELWCDIEASSTFETFVAETAKFGCMPLVVPELKTITVGGAIVGIGIESSSFKHGFVHEGLLEADLLAASGEVLTVSAQGPYADLFAAVPNSLGAFGYLLRLRMRIQRTKPYVQLRKEWFDSPEALVDGIEQACEPAQGNDFVDAVALSCTGGMLVTAKFEQALPEGREASDYTLTRQFYRTLVDEGDDWMRVTDYIWRWDTDWFWCTQIFPLMSFAPMRALCGRGLLRSDMYKLFNDKMITVLEKTGANKNQELVIQDIEVPLAKSAEWVRVHMRVCPSERIGKIKLKRGEQNGATVPLWLCPVKGTSAPLMPMDPGKLYINFGFWDAVEGEETIGGDEAGNVNRQLEAACTEHGALKTLYSNCFLSEEDFAAQYNGEYYDQVKQKYDPAVRLRHRYTRLTSS